MKKQNKMKNPLVEKYFQTYLTGELIQDPSKGRADPQLSSIALTLGEEMQARPGGVVIDIGAGKGSLLNRIAEIPAFATNPAWSYLAVEIEERHGDILLEANRLKLLQRVEVQSIDQFVARMVVEAQNRIFFCRNVFHELSIDLAASVISSVCVKFCQGDVFLMQDLLRFPEGERGHHCWTSEHFASALQEVGFTKVNNVPFWSPSGNAWFNVTARNLENVPQEQAVRDALVRARTAQWRLWVDVNREDSVSGRDVLLEALDINLQLASLTSELQRRGVIGVQLDTEMENRIRLAAIVRPIESLARENSISGTAIEAPKGFRERGAQLYKAENFLRSDARLVLVYGGVGTGKTTFLEQLLSARSYDKVIVRLDAKASPGVWPLLETMLTQLGVRLSGDVIAALGSLKYSQVAPAIGAFLNRFASMMVFMIENVDEVLDSNGRFVDTETSDFLCQLIRKEGVKVIISARTEYLPPAIQSAAGTRLVETIHIRRFATVETVINVLDDYFNRAGAGLAEYPDALLMAIDRHPMIASLAGRILAHDGTGVLDDRFFYELRNKLRSQLMERLVSDQSRPAIEVAGEIRVPVPATVLEQLTTRISVAAARDDDVLYSVPDRRWTELLTPLGLLRKRTGDDLLPASAQEMASADSSLHARISTILKRIYQADNDPKWARESYFHAMLSGSIEINVTSNRYYFTELVGSAHYCFDHARDYPAALRLYNAAHGIGSLDEKALMWRASSMIRTGAVQDGDAEYARLTSAYPLNIGMRRSHVDALLFIHRFHEAKEKLREYGLTPDRDTWHANQWGRAELGLHNYQRAIEIFTALRPQRPTDSHVVTYLARALQQFGDLPNAIAVLEEGIENFGDNEAIATSLGMNLERARKDVRAREILEPLFASDLGNTRAALALIRIMLRNGQRWQAESILRKAEQAASSSMQSHIHMANAELLIAKPDPLAAAEYLRVHASGDEATATLHIEALLMSADLAVSPDERDALLKEAAAVEIPGRLKFNVPVQIASARLAIVRRDRTRFDQILANLAPTRVDRDELERLRQRWDQENSN